MNLFLQWFAAPEWALLVKTLLHSLWQGAVISTVLALILRRLVPPRLRYRCSFLALVAIPLVGVITWAVLSASNRPLPAPTATPIAIEPAVATATPGQSPEAKLVVLLNQSPALPPVQWTAWAALLWIVGAGAMLGRAGIKVAGAERLRRACRPLDDPPIRQLVTEARRAVGLLRQVRVAVTDKLTSPAVVGVIVPTLILPLTVVTTLTPEQIRFILLHELAHIRRGDYFANLFQLFTEALLFFNPAVWWISHQVRREREACCDALAIELSGAPADYARTLIQVAENVLNPAPTAAPAFGGQREPSSLMDRVQRLLVPGYRPALRLTWRAMIAAIVLGTTLLVLSAEGTRMAVAQLSQPPEQTNPGKETRAGTSDVVLTGSSSQPPSEFTPGTWPLAPAQDILGGSELFSLGESQLPKQWFWYRTKYGSHMAQVPTWLGTGVTRSRIHPAATGRPVGERTLVPGRTRRRLKSQACTSGATLNMTLLPVERKSATVAWLGLATPRSARTPFCSTNDSATLLPLAMSESQPLPAVSKVWISASAFPPI